MKKHIPNFLTLCNLFSGLCGITMVMEGELNLALYGMLLGGLFDFLDGFVARGLNIVNPLGKQLDSLADLVTFGTLPALSLYKLIGQYTSSSFIPLLAMPIALAGAFRLARFNIDTKQTLHFIGLPIPAAGIFIGTLPSVLQIPRIGIYLECPYRLLCIGIIIAWLMISRIHFPALKFTSYDWQSNRATYSFLILGACCILLNGIAGCALVLVIYILSSAVKSLFYS